MIFYIRAYDDGFNGIHLYDSLKHTEIPVDNTYSVRSCLQRYVNKEYGEESSTPSWRYQVFQICEQVDINGLLSVTIWLCKMSMERQTTTIG